MIGEALTTALAFVVVIGTVAVIIAFSSRPKSSNEWLTLIRLLFLMLLATGSFVFLLALIQEWAR